MHTIGDAVRLYVDTIKRWKDKADKNVVRRAAVYNGGVYVDGQPYEYDSVAADRFANGDVVYVAQTDNDGKVVVLG